MGGRMIVVLYVAAMAAIIVGVDVAFFRNRFWERLMSNIGIVLLFAALGPALPPPSLIAHAALHPMRKRPRLFGRRGLSA